MIFLISNNLCGFLETFLFVNQSLNQIGKFTKFKVTLSLMISDKVNNIKCLNRLHFKYFI